MQQSEAACALPSHAPEPVGERVDAKRAGIESAVGSRVDRKSLRRVWIEVDALRELLALATIQRRECGEIAIEVRPKPRLPCEGHLQPVSSNAHEVAAGQLGDCTPGPGGRGATGHTDDLGEETPARSSRARQVGGLIVAPNAAWIGQRTEGGQVVLDGACPVLHLRALR